MNILRNTVRISISNIINLGSSFILGFILPAYLTINEYGMYKEFTLYLSFVFIFNFGYNDGIFIKYGGQDILEIDKEVLHREHTFIWFFQLMVTIIICIISMFTNNSTLTLFSLAIFLMTMSTYHKNFLQAVGLFKTYSMANVFTTAINILTVLFAIFVLHSSYHKVYIIMLLITQLLTYLFYEYNFYKEFGFKFSLYLNNNKIFKIGIYILIANMSMAFIGNIGSWFANLVLPIEKFATYSFSTSLLNMSLLVINSAGLVFYNAIAKDENENMLKFTKQILLLIGIYGGLAFFVFKIIINVFLEVYTDSIPLISITFLSIPYIMVTNVIIINIYKSRKNEKKYFRDTSLLAIFGFLFVGLVSVLTKSIIYIAFSTIIIYILWYIYSTEKEIKYLKNSKRELLLLISHLVIFYFSANVESTFLGITIYIIYLFFVSFLFKDIITDIFKFIKNS